ncbi:RES family NAD+ phosphorylase [Rhodococcus tibetensis]|uniref:RES family NAD+ phosphorylase n=1 Tax=Rhodococcus tibetensis TaxID=2965064 RepID=A0ABT1QKF4_9NOCA|nr:RES family NAD+ phosphorylase [Rhodococcus sp. FXJ9.536]MCQ4122783.1 RES family NAD+ phosphorylase [Rhodococcus sp. FXJ9.536]
MSTVPAGTTMHRTHGAKFGPWWFGTTLGGRFDLPGPDGTCYTAESELITLLETWGGIQLIPSTEIAQRAISALAVHRELHVADATSNAAIQFGITSEISTTADYALTQQWAQALRAAGFDGIRYWARHEMTHVDACLALFAPSGDQTSTVAIPSDFTVLGTQALPDRPDLWDSLQEKAGIEVLDIPGSI